MRLHVVNSGKMEEAASVIEVLWIHAEGQDGEAAASWLAVLSTLDVASCYLYAFVCVGSLRLSIGDFDKKAVELMRPGISRGLSWPGCWIAVCGMSVLFRVWPVNNFVRVYVRYAANATACTSPLQAKESGDNAVIPTCLRLRFQDWHRQICPAYYLTTWTVILQRQDNSQQDHNPASLEQMRC